MPHKRNPVLTENLTGISRLIRSSVIPSLENIALWHERDISHSSVERVIAPDTTTLIDFALARLTNVIKNIGVNKKNIEENLNKLNGLIYSQRILLLLTQKGLSREASYDLVQRNAGISWEKQTDFQKIIESDPEISKLLTNEEISDIFSLEYHLKNVDYIFDKVFAI